MRAENEFQRLDLPEIEVEIRARRDAIATSHNPHQLIDEMGKLVVLQIALRGHHIANMMARTRLDFDTCRVGLVHAGWNLDQALKDLEPRLPRSRY